MVSIKLHVSTNHTDPQDDARPELAEFSDTDLVEGLPRHHRLGQVREGEEKECANFYYFIFLQNTGASAPKANKKKKKKRQQSKHSQMDSFIDGLIKGAHPRDEDDQDDQRGGRGGGGGAGVRRQHSLREMFPPTTRNFKLEVIMILIIIIMPSSLLLFLSLSLFSSM